MKIKFWTKKAKNTFCSHYLKDNELMALLGVENLKNIENEINNFKTVIPVKYREMLKTVKKFEAMGMKEEEAKLEAFEYMKGAN